METDFPPLSAFVHKLNNEPPYLEKWERAKEILISSNVTDVINLADIADTRVKLLQGYLVLNVKNYSSFIVRNLYYDEVQDCWIYKGTLNYYNPLIVNKKFV